MMICHVSGFINSHVSHVKYYVFVVVCIALQ